MKKLALISTVLIALLAVAGTASAHWDNAFDLILEDYEPIRQALADGRLGGVADHAEAIEVELLHLKKNISARHAGVDVGKAKDVFDRIPGLLEATAALRSARTVGEARAAFLDLSEGLARWQGSLEFRSRAVVVRCEPENRVWLQPRKTVKRLLNPYGTADTERCERVG